MSELGTLVSGFKRAPVLNAKAQWPKTYKARFIQPGLVHYDDMGTVLVERPMLNKMAQSLVGKPVIDEVHKDVSPENFKDIADGVVIRVWTDPADGWDWCEFLVWDEETRRHCESKDYMVSCAYTPTKVSEQAGKHNNIEYDGEFLDGTYTHLAIVKDPRYEGAIIVTNSKGGKTMFELFRKKPVENTERINASDAYLEIDGESVPLSDAVKAYEAQNSKAQNLKDDDVVRINGKDVTGRELKNAYMAECKRKDAKNKEEGMETGDQKKAEEDEEKEGKKRDKGEKAENDIEEKSVKEDEEKREKAEKAEKGNKKEAKNAVEEETQEASKNAQEFRESFEMRNNDPAMPSINTMSDRLDLGKSRYGKDKKEAK